MGPAGTAFQDASSPPFKPPDIVGVNPSSLSTRQSTAGGAQGDVGAWFAGSCQVPVDAQQSMPAAFAAFENGGQARIVFDITAQHRGMATFSLCPCQWPDDDGRCTRAHGLPPEGLPPNHTSIGNLYKCLRRHKLQARRWQPPDLQNCNEQPPEAYMFHAVPRWDGCSNQPDSTKCTPAFFKAGGQNDPGSVSVEGFGVDDWYQPCSQGGSPCRCTCNATDSCFHPFGGNPAPGPLMTRDAWLYKGVTNASECTASTGCQVLHPDSQPINDPVMKPLVAIECVNGDNGCNGTGYTLPNYCGASVSSNAHTFVVEVQLPSTQELLALHPAAFEADDLTVKHAVLAWNYQDMNDQVRTR